MSTITTEAVVYNIESALNAEKGGADRVELCDNPGGGGTTPSWGTMKILREELNIDLFIMIRPREGDFCYSDLEFEAMKADIGKAQQLGADGVVFGILSSDGTIDKPRNKKLVDLARPLEVTCHRAFDMARDPFEALNSCIDAGFDRILTSGQKAQAREGIPLIRDLVQKADGQISIMAGCGVNENTAEEIIKRTGVQEIHLAAETTRASVMEFQNSAINGMGFITDKEYKVDITDASRIAEIRRKAREAHNNS